jgi:hypothetical protein
MCALRRGGAGNDRGAGWRPAAAVANLGAHAVIERRLTGLILHLFRGACDIL